MNIYFCGAIGGGREKQSTYKELITFCKQYGRVFNECVGKKNLRVHKGMNIYSRNMDWINMCDVVIAEVTVPSLGVGMEIEHAIQRNPNLPVLCLYDTNDIKNNISKMVTNCPNIALFGYLKSKMAEKIIYDFFVSHNLIDKRECFVPDFSATDESDTEKGYEN